MIHRHYNTTYVCVVVKYYIPDCASLIYIEFTRRPTRTHIMGQQLTIRTRQRLPSVSSGLSA